MKKYGHLTLRVIHNQIHNFCCECVCVFLFGFGNHAVINNSFTQFHGFLSVYARICTFTCKTTDWMLYERSMFYYLFLSLLKETKKTSNNKLIWAAASHAPIGILCIWIKSLSQFAANSHTNINTNTNRSRNNKTNWLDG